MSAALPQTSQHSRPKVHRPPTLPRERCERRIISTVLNYGDTARQIFTISSIALVLVLTALLGLRFFPARLKSDNNAAINAEIALPPSQKTIVLRNENDVIIGQMARITSAPEPHPEVSTMSSTIDKNKGQQLLSIIGKY